MEFPLHGKMDNIHHFPPKTLKGNINKIKWLEKYEQKRIPIIIIEPICNN